MTEVVLVATYLAEASIITRTATETKDKDGTVDSVNPATIFVDINEGIGYFELDYSS